MKILYLLIFLFPIQFLNSQIKTPPLKLDWLNDTIGPGPGEVKSVTADRDDNVFVVGHFGFYDEHSSYSYGGAFVSKYNSLGKLIWCDTILGSVNTCMIGSAGDRDGNVYVLLKSDRRITVGGSDYTGYSATFLAKYNGSGQVLWVWQESYLDAYSIACDEAGNVYVSCRSLNTFPPRNYSGVYRFDPDGNHRQVFSLEDKNQHHATIDAWGNIYVFADVVFGNPRSCLFKYSQAGEKLWQRDMPNGPISIDNAGNCWSAASGVYDTVSVMRKMDPLGNIILTDSLPFVVTALQADLSGVYACGYSRLLVIANKYDQSAELKASHKRSYFTNDWPINQVPNSIFVSNRSVYYGGKRKLYYYGSSCGFLARLQNDGTVAVPEQHVSINSILVPNPCNGSFKVTCNEPTPVTISIYDNTLKLLYKEVFQDENSQHQVLLPGFNEGIYFLKISTNAFTEHKRLIIKK